MPELRELHPMQLAEFLCQFVLEVRKNGEEEFSPNSLYHIVCGVQRHVRFNGQPSIDFFNNCAFANLKLTLNAKMKRLQKEVSVPRNAKLSDLLSMKMGVEFAWFLKSPSSGGSSWLCTEEWN